VPQFGEHPDFTLESPIIFEESGIAGHPGMRPVSIFTSGIDTILNCSAYFSANKAGASAASVSDMVLTSARTGRLPHNAESS